MSDDQGIPSAFLSTDRSLTPDEIAALGDEWDRRHLVPLLRNADITMCDEAADEIERLRALLGLDPSTGYPSVTDEP